jgi:hypothetical protein
LPNAAWCPICGAKLSETKKDGKTVLKCPVDGELKSFLEQDPLALAKHCDDLGVDELEAGAKITQAIAESSFQEAP